MCTVKTYLRLSRQLRNSAQANTEILVTSETCLGWVAINRKRQFCTASNGDTSASSMMLTGLVKNLLLSWVFLQGGGRTAVIWF